MRVPGSISPREVGIASSITVFRALVGYGIAAFAVLQIIEPVMHGLHWPIR